MALQLKLTAAFRLGSPLDVALVVRPAQAPLASSPRYGRRGHWRSYTYVALSASSRAIVSYLTGKRSSENTDLFIQDLRQRVVGHPEFSPDGWRPYKNSIGDIFGNRAPHGVISKTYSVRTLP